MEFKRNCFYCPTELVQLVREGNVVMCPECLTKYVVGVNMTCASALPKHVISRTDREARKSYVKSLPEHSLTEREKRCLTIERSEKERGWFELWAATRLKTIVLPRKEREWIERELMGKEPDSECREVDKMIDEPQWQRCKKCNMVDGQTYSVEYVEKLCPGCPVYETYVKNYGPYK